MDGVIRFRDNRNILVEMPVLDCSDPAMASVALTDALGVPVAISPSLNPMQGRSRGPVVGRRAQ